MEIGVIQWNGKLTGGGALENAIVEQTMPDDEGDDRVPIDARRADEVDAVLVVALQFGRVVAIPAHDPVHEVDAEPRRDPHDDDADELLHVERERRLELGLDGEAAREDAVEHDRLVALQSKSHGLERDARGVQVE